MLSYPSIVFPVSIAQLLEAFDGVERDAAAFVEGLDEVAFNCAPAPGSWSAAQCLGHLTATLGAYVPAMEGALLGAGGSERAADIHPGFVSRWFIHQMEPPVRRRYKAPRRAVPQPAAVGRDEGWQKFQAANDAYRALARRCVGVDVNRLRFPNPFAPLRFTLGTGLTVVVAHHRRHVCQMEHAVQAVASRS